MIFPQADYVKPDIRPFHAMTIGAAAFRMQEAGECVIHMEYGQPSAHPPVPVMASAKDMLDTDSEVRKSIDRITPWFEARI